MADVVERLRATCPDHEVEITVTVRTERVPVDPLAPPAEQEEELAVTPNDALDGWPICPGCDEPMVVDRD